MAQKTNKNYKMNVSGTKSNMDKFLPCDLKICSACESTSTVVLFNRKPHALMKANGNFLFSHKQIIWAYTHIYFLRFLHLILLPRLYLFMNKIFIHVVGESFICFEPNNEKKYEKAKQQRLLSRPPNRSRKKKWIEIKTQKWCVCVRSFLPWETANIHKHYISLHIVYTASFIWNEIK